MPFIDSLKGFPEAIGSIFPKTEVQLCIVNKIRNSLKYVGSKGSESLHGGLEAGLQGGNKELAFSELDRLEELWDKKYPIVIRSWRNNGERLSGYFKYPDHLHDGYH